MRKIESLMNRVQDLIDKAPKKSYALFWEEILGIMEAKVYDYKMTVGQELPFDFLYDVFDSYIEKYKADNYHKQLSELNEPLAVHLILFNKGLAPKTPLSKEEFLLDKFSWSNVFSDFNPELAVTHIPAIDYKNGCSFNDLLKSFKIELQLNKNNAYERDRIKKSWMFFKTYIFRVIPDNGVIFAEDIIDCLKLFIDYETPKNRFDNEKISNIKQYVGTFNDIFKTKIKLHDVGLSYSQLRQSNPEKDGWLRTDDDEKHLQEFRKLVHYYLDQLWNNSSEEIKKQMTRAEAYSWLSSALMIPRNQTHVALFNEQMCAKAILEIFHYLGR